MYYNTDITERYSILLMNESQINNKISKNILTMEIQTTYQNVWDATKLVPGRTFIT